MEAFELGGWGMWPTLIFGVLLLAASVRYAIRPETRWVPLCVSLGLLTVFSGILGFTMGTIRASLHASGQPDALELALAGFGESLYNIALAMILVVMAAMAGALGALRLARAQA